MEKRNTIERGRTPCRAGTSRFCDCPDCVEKQFEKQGGRKLETIQDVQTLSEKHK